MKAGTLTIDAAAYLAEPRIRALSQALRAVLLEVRCAAVLSPEPGVLRFDLSDVAKMIGCGREQLQQLVDLGHIEGAPAGAVCSPLIHVDRRGTQHVLIPPPAGRCGGSDHAWWSHSSGSGRGTMAVAARRSGARGSLANIVPGAAHLQGCPTPYRVPLRVRARVRHGQRFWARQTGRCRRHPSGCRTPFRVSPRLPPPHLPFSLTLLPLLRRGRRRRLRRRTGEAGRQRRRSRRSCQKTSARRRSPRFGRSGSSTSGRSGRR